MKPKAAAAAAANTIRSLFRKDADTAEAKLMAAAACSASGAHRQAAAAAKAEDFNCNICFEILVDPVVGVCGHDFCQRCLRQWNRHQQHTTTSFLGSVTCPVCRKVFAAGHTAVEDLGVCIRLRDMVALLFPEQLAVRKAEVQQEEARAAAAAQPASRSPALAPAAGPPALAAAVAAGTAAPPAAALLFDDAWDDDQEEEEEEEEDEEDEEDEYTEVYDWVVGCPIPYGLESDDETPAMNALAAVMDDLNWLWEHGHPHLAGLTPTAALEALRVADGGVLCTDDGAASASEVSTVLRKAQEAQASGRNLVDVLRTPNLGGAVPPTGSGAAAAPRVAALAPGPMGSSAGPPSRQDMDAWNWGFEQARQALGYRGPGPFGDQAAALGPAGSIGSFGFAMPPPAQYTVPGQIPAPHGGVGGGHPLAQSGSNAGFGPAQPALAGRWVPGMAYVSSSQPLPAAPAPAPPSGGFGAPGMAQLAGQQQRFQQLMQELQLQHVQQRAQLLQQAQEMPRVQDQQQMYGASNGPPQGLVLPRPNTDSGAGQQQQQQQQQPGSLLPPRAAAFLEGAGSAAVQGAGRQQQGGTAAADAAAAAAAGGGGGGGGPVLQPGNAPVFTMGWYDGSGNSAAAGGDNSNTTRGRRANIRWQR